MKTASFGSISTGTLRPQDLLNSFHSELERQINRNGDYFSKPENFDERDKLNNLLGEVQDCFLDDENIDPEKEELVDDLIQELENALQIFAPSYGYFGAHCGDGSDFGFWVDIENVKEQVEFVSSKYQEYPDEDFVGEWLYINERGNCTLYVRESGKDKEIWSIV